MISSHFQNPNSLLRLFNPQHEKRLGRKLFLHIKSKSVRRIDRYSYMDLCDMNDLMPHFYFTDNINEQLINEQYIKAFEPYAPDDHHLTEQLRGK